MVTQQQIKQYNDELIQLIKESGVSPQIYSSFGEMAKNTIKDPALYPILIEQLTKYKIIDPGEYDNKINFSLIKTLALMGKLAEQISKGAA
jgi:hypothetical protein